MLSINPQAQVLNDTINKNNPTILSLLSDRGKTIFFPKKGILGQSAEAKGKQINATIGIATDNNNEPLYLKSLQKNITQPPTDVYPYAPSYGLPALRKAWKEQLFTKNLSLAGKQFSLPIVTTGITHSLSLAGYLFINKEDEIILPDLFWGNYKLIFQEAYGATLKTFTTFKDRKFNTQGLIKELENKGDKKVVLLNFPNNPTGYTPTKTEIKQIVQAIIKSASYGKQILVLIDDAYFGLVYKEDVEQQSLFSYLCDVHPNILAVKLDGATKEDYVWGFRVAFITYGAKTLTNEAYEALEDKTAGALRGNISSSSHLSQSLLLSAYKDPSYIKEKQAHHRLLESRFHAVEKTLSQHPEYQRYFKAYPYNSGYFMSLELNGELDAEKVRQLLLDKYDTGVIAFENNIRVAFSAVPTISIPVLFTNMFSACQELLK